MVQKKKKKKRRGDTAPEVSAEHPCAPGAAGGDSRAASATSPPLAASPGRPRQPPRGAEKRPGLRSRGPTGP